MTRGLKTLKKFYKNFNNPVIINNNKMMKVKEGLWYPFTTKNKLMEIFLYYNR